MPQGNHEQQGHTDIQPQRTYYKVQAGDLQCPSDGAQKDQSGQLLEAAKGALVKPMIA